MELEEIPPDVRAFILAAIPTVGHMETLLLVQEGRDRDWSAADVARRLYVPEAEALTFLRDLAQARLVAPASREGRYRYGPADAGLAEQASRTVDAYKQRLVAVTRLIHARVDAGRQFADAFRIRRS